MKKRFDFNDPKFYAAQMTYAKATARFLLFLGILIGLLVPTVLDFLIKGHSSILFTINSILVGVVVGGLLMIYYYILRSLARKKLSEEDYEKVRRVIEPKKKSKGQKKDDTIWMLGLIVAVILMFILATKLEGQIVGSLGDYGNAVTSLQSVPETVESEQ